jgi:hypothetical protein
MLLQIVLHTPGWVWGLFAALLALGVAQSRPRAVHPLQLLALPLVLLGLGLSSLLPAFASMPVLAVVWLAALGLGLRTGLWLPVASTTRWDSARMRLHLAGSWLPLVVILIIFSLRYTAAVSLALHPAWRQELTVQVPLCLAFGALSGLFLGRALGLRRLVRA